MLAQRGSAGRTVNLSENSSMVNEVSQGAINDAIHRAQSIANLLGNTNGTALNILERLNGPQVQQGSQSMSPEAAYPGQLGELMEALDRVFSLASSNSDIVGQFARL